MNRFLVIGAGMAGLLSARAIEDVTGCVPTIITDRPPKRITPSDFNGVHILHDKCSLPDVITGIRVTNYMVIPGSDGMIEPFEELSAFERKAGNAAYGDKVYGKRIRTSILRMPNVINGYDYAQSYNWLLDRFISRIIIRKPVNERMLFKLADEYDLVVFTAPRFSVAPELVKHPSVTVWVSNRPPIGMSDSGLSRNFVVYNPDATDPWYRTSRVNGSWHTEYCHKPRYFVPDLREVYKVREGDRWVPPENVLLAGRHGRWEPGVLASDAYWQVGDRVREMVMIDED